MALIQTKWCQYPAEAVAELRNADQLEAPRLHLGRLKTVVKLDHQPL